MAASHPKLLKEKTITRLTSFLPELGDTFLANEDIRKLTTRFSKPKRESIAENVAKSGLLQSKSFPNAVRCP